MVGCSWEQWVNGIAIADGLLGWSLLGVTSLPLVVSPPSLLSWDNHASLIQHPCWALLSQVQHLAGTEGSDFLAGQAGVPGFPLRPNHVSFQRHLTLRPAVSTHTLPTCYMRSHILLCILTLFLSCRECTFRERLSLAQCPCCGPLLFQPSLPQP